MEGQSERDEKVIEGGEGQREEAGSEVVEQMDRETKSGAETQREGDETEERKTPHSDKITERSTDEAEYSIEEEEQSERDGEKRNEEGKKNCEEQNEVVEEPGERVGSDGEEKEVVERGRSCSEEQRDDDAEEGISEGEGKTSLKHSEEDEETDKESKVMETSKDEAFGQLENFKESTDMPLQQKSMLGKRVLSRCDRLPSEVRSVNFDPSPQALMLVRCLQV